jgi:hypothetical protein
MHEGRSALESECIAYCRYLIRQPPGRYVIEKYCAAHEPDGPLSGIGLRLLDRFLWKVSHRSFLLRLIDAFTLIFARHSILRKKWLLLIGILESSEPTSIFFDQPDPASRSMLIATMVCNGILFVFCVVISTVFLGPPALVLRIYERLFLRSH